MDVFKWQHLLLLNIFTAFVTTDHDVFTDCFRKQNQFCMFYENFMSSFFVDWDIVGVNVFQNAFILDDILLLGKLTLLYSSFAFKTFCSLW